MKFWHKCIVAGAIGAVVIGNLAIIKSQAQSQGPAPWQVQNTAIAQQQQETPSPDSGTVNVNNHLTPGPGQRLFVLANKWNQTIWVQALTSFGGPLATTHWVLPAGASVSTPVPSHWDGRFWGDTACSVDGNGVPLGCVTGHCPPTNGRCESGAPSFATLAEFNLQYPGGNDIYDVSLVDGYNLPMYINTLGGSTPDILSANGCLRTPLAPGGPTGCTTDANVLCANSLYSDLQVKDADGNVVACKSACTMFVGEGHSPDDPTAAPYCCPGGSAYGTPQTCHPHTWPPNLSSEKIFKQAEPFAYSYAFDDPTSTLSCSGSCGYVITFGVSS